MIKGETMNIDDMTVGELKQVAEIARGITGAGCATKAPPSGRAVVVVDRGWIFAGDMSLTADGHIRLDNAVHVFRWESIGFARMIAEWKTKAVDLRPCDAVEIPEDAVVFRIPVAAGWGVK